jgi:hypothetical protein
VGGGPPRPPVGVGCEMRGGRVVLFLALLCRAAKTDLPCHRPAVWQLHTSVVLRADERAPPRRCACSSCCERITGAALLLRGGCEEPDKHVEALDPTPILDEIMAEDGPEGVGTGLDGEPGGLFYGNEAMVPESGTDETAISSRQKAEGDDSDVDVLDCGISQASSSEESGEGDSEGASASRATDSEPAREPESEANIFDTDVPPPAVIALLSKFKIGHAAAKEPRTREQQAACAQLLHLLLPPAVDRTQRGQGDGSGLQAASTASKDLWGSAEEAWRRGDVVQAESLFQRALAGATLDPPAPARAAAFFAHARRDLQRSRTVLLGAGAGAGAAGADGGGAARRWESDAALAALLVEGAAASCDARCLPPPALLGRMQAPPCRHAAMRARPLCAGGGGC